MNAVDPVVDVLSNWIAGECDYCPVCCPPDVARSFTICEKRIRAWAEREVDDKQDAAICGLRKCYLREEMERKDAALKHADRLHDHVWIPSATLADVQAAAREYGDARRAALTEGDEG